MPSEMPPARGFDWNFLPRIVDEPYARAPLDHANFADRDRKLGCKRGDRIIHLGRCSEQQLIIVAASREGGGLLPSLAQDH